MTDDNIEHLARIDLAAALRWAARLGFGEGVCNHFSAALPGSSDRFLINPQGLHWSEVTPADLVLVDAHGRKITGLHNVEPTAFFIHGCIHRGKPAAKCVLHTHMPYATALTVIEQGRVEWVSQNALKFYGRVAYDDDYNGLALDDAEGERMCARLADADILFLANHGVIVTGLTLATTFDDLYYLERACMLQVLAMGTGRPLKTVAESIASKTAGQMAQESQQATLHFEALKRMLDRDEPGWKG
ncbi:MAG TPA: aldolase [Burkholderiales bacterium]|jgi:ribulose-5-phosphate 4-epimerase/fuculose-1-phosphate aldolase|nr:aldolase [Burkholderiales bacterium]